MLYLLRGLIFAWIKFRDFVFWLFAKINPRKVPSYLFELYIF